MGKIFERAQHPIAPIILTAMVKLVVSEEAPTEKEPTSLFRLMW